MKEQRGVEEGPERDGAASQTGQIQEKQEGFGD